MAKFVANTEFRYQDPSVSGVFRFDDLSDFYNNNYNDQTFWSQSFSFEGQTYGSHYRIQWRDDESGDFFNTVLAGNGLGFSFNGRPSNGPVEAIVTYDNANVLQYAITEIAVGAGPLMQVTQTSSLSDDISLYVNMIFNSDDLFILSSADDVARGYGGRDLMYGKDGNDFLIGDEGRDTLYGGRGNDTLVGGADDDALHDGTGNDSVQGEAGNDRMYAAGGNDELDGGEGSDWLVLTKSLGSAVDLAIIGAQNFGYGADTLVGIENIDGNSGDDTLQGDQRANVLLGRDGNDQLIGRDGNDRLGLDAGDDTLNGGAGVDWVLVKGAANALIDLALTGSQATGYGTDLITDIENLSGGTGNDTLRGDANANQLRGNLGDDQLFGRGGRDTLFADAGNDVIDGGGGLDWLFVAGSTGATIDLSVTGPQATGYGTDSIQRIEAVSGGTGDDSLGGTASRNWLKGGDGNDTLRGVDGSDILYADNGDDHLDGGTGSDWLYVRDTRALTVDLSVTTAQNTGFGQDRITNIQNVSGGSGWDIMHGDAGTNRLDGNDGNDRLYGRDGNDIIKGGAGGDYLFGGADNDRLIGGAGGDRLYADLGNDILDGGDGSDWFYVTGAVAATVDLAIAIAQDTGFGLDRLSNIENLFGSTAGDVLLGDAGVNVFLGNAGADHIDGRGGNDVIYGGPDNDTLIGGEGDDRIWGHDGNDDIDAGLGDDTVDGGAGEDWLRVTGSMAATINLALITAYDTGYGTDQITGIEHVEGGTGRDTLTGDTADNELRGGWGDDRLFGGAGNDTLLGQGGNDTIYMDAGDDIIDGGSGYDWLMVGGSTGLWVDLSYTFAQNTGYGIDTITNINHVSGGIGNDLIYGRGQSGVLRGNAGNDTLRGGSIMEGGIGNDVLISSVTDTLRGNTLRGGEGNDGFYEVTGKDTIDGGDGIDWIHLSPGASVDLSGRNVQNVENIQGSSVADGLTGNSEANILRGGDGGDYLDGNGGNDQVFGEGGNDNIRLSPGNSTLDGGDGSDRLVVGRDNPVVIDLGRTTVQYTVTGNHLIRNIENIDGSRYSDWLAGSDGSNQIFAGDGNDTVYGRDGFDGLYGGEGDDALFGGDFTDNLKGGAGDDFLNGESGHDRIWGDAGNDTIIGGTSGDLLEGGSDDDIFQFDAITHLNDTITDFDRLDDLIDLSRIDASTSAAGNNSFTFIGTNAFTASDVGQIRYEVTTTTDLIRYSTGFVTRVFIDNDDDADHEAILLLNGDLFLTQSDFVL